MQISLSASVRFSLGMALCVRRTCAFCLRGEASPPSWPFTEMLDWIWRSRQVPAESSEKLPVTIEPPFVSSSACGFEAYGINRASKLRGGKLVDQVALGIFETRSSRKTITSMSFVSSLVGEFSAQMPRTMRPTPESRARRTPRSSRNRTRTRPTSFSKASGPALRPRKQPYQALARLPPTTWPIC